MWGAALSEISITSASSDRAAASNMYWELKEYMKKGTPSAQPPEWMEGLGSQATKMVWKVLLLGQAGPEAKLPQFIFFLERCKRAVQRQLIQSHLQKINRLKDRFP